MVKIRMSEKANKIIYMVLSLLLATAFWLYVDFVNENTIKETYTNIPIDFIGAEDTLPSRGLMLASGEDATLDVTLRGPRSVISNLKASDIRGQANLTTINAAGPYSISVQIITPDDVNDSDITVERRSRNNVSIQVTSLYSKEIPVSVSVKGSVPDPYVYMANRVVVQPTTLDVSGLQNNVDQVASARVVVDITDATETIQRDYSYELLDADGEVLEELDVRVPEQQVNVTVPVYLTKKLPLTVKYKESPGSTLEHTTVKLEPSEITVVGDPMSLESLEEINLGEVDLSAYQDDQEMDLDIKLPAGCENSSGSITAHLSISFHGLTTRSFAVSNISAANLSSTQKFDPIVTAVNVVLRGPAEDLEQVTEDDIRIVVDLKDVTTDGAISPVANVYVDGYNEVGAVGSHTVPGKIIYN